MMTEVKPWAERSNTISIIPGKKDERRESLAEIAAQLPRHPGEYIRVRRASGPPQDVPVEKVTQDQLSRGGLSRREGNGPWILADVVVHWLDDPSDDRLAEHLHANVKFFGELLAAIEKLHSKAEFLDFAAEFGLRWTSTTQLYARINWMELLGLVERWESYKFVVTPRGHEYLARTELTDRSQAQGSALVPAGEELELPEPGEGLVELLADLTSTKLAKRKVLIGYIPRGRKAPDRDSDAGSQSPLEALRTLVELIGDRCRSETFYSRCIDQLGMKRTSASQTLQTMRQMNIVESVALN